MKHCSYIYENGCIEPLTEDKIIRLREIEKQESNQAYRVLAYAYKQINESYSLDESLENNLIFVGMTSMIDPPRPDVKKL